MFIQALSDVKIEKDTIVHVTPPDAIYPSVHLPSMLRTTLMRD